MLSTVLVISLLGVSLGSFVASSAYRIPLGVSLFRKWSFCPNCLRAIRPYDLIPIASYLILRGRCRDCGVEISFRYILIECLSLVVSLFALEQFGLTLDFAFALLACLLLLMIAAIDWEHLLIPDGLVLLGLLGGMIHSMSNSEDLGWDMISVFSAVFMMVLVRTIGNRFLSRESMGLGDVKLCGVISLFLGLELFLLSLWLAALMGLSYGLYQQASFDPNLSRGLTLIPFGSFLASAAIICILLRTHIELAVSQWLISIP